MANEIILQVPLTTDYRDRIAADATRDDRTSARQAAYLIKAFYDGRLVWSPSAAPVAPVVVPVAPVEGVAS